jgi:hypothetical protein
MKDSNSNADRREIGGDTTDPNRHPEETLVADSRAALTPSQYVEQRLIGMLRASPLMVSQVQRRLKPGPR